MLVSQKKLCEAVSKITRHSLTDNRPAVSLALYESGPLISPDKKPGARPMSVREVLKRTGGNVLRCSVPMVKKSGIENIKQTRRKKVQTENDASLLIAAENAFSSLNLTLRNDEKYCPEMFIARLNC